MNLVLFDDALEHLTRIHRVIRMDKGNALLVGVGGSGKASRKFSMKFSKSIRFIFFLFYSHTFGGVRSRL